MKIGTMAEEVVIRTRVMAEEAIGTTEAVAMVEIAGAIKVISNATIVAIGGRTTASSTTTNRTTATTNPGNHIANNKVSLRELGSSNKTTTINLTINSRIRRSPRK